MLKKIKEDVGTSYILNGEGSSEKVRVAINGFGRIGRAFLKVAIMEKNIDIVAVNDLGDIHNMAYLLKYDTVYKRSDFDIDVEEKDGMRSLIIKLGKSKKVIKFFSERDPMMLPWGKEKIDIVVESTGLFTAYDKARVHLDAGAKRVVISAPAKEGEDKSVKGETVLMCINEDRISHVAITSNASCTTNASSPLIAILDEKIGIQKAILNTVHAYTASQSIVDGPNKKDYREGRAAAQNIVPSSTGAAIAVTKAFTALENKFDGIAMRVPVPAGSVVDITFIAKRDTTAEEVNQILRDAAMTEKWKDIFSATDEELVSSDIQGLPYASIADLKMTRVVDGNLVKVLGWYDNEMGYTHTLVRHIKEVGKRMW